MVVRTLTCAAAAAFLCLPMTGCGGGTDVKRVDANEVHDKSGNWNDIDSQDVAKKMIADVMTRPWIGNFQKAESRNPVVKVGRVIVRSNGDIIDTDIFTNDIVREFINSGQVDAVRATGDEWQTREELKNQDKYASASSRKEAFQELGADYLMTGTIKVQNDQEGREMVKFYSVDLQLEDVMSGKLVWLGNHKLKKLVQRPR